MPNDIAPIDPIRQALATAKDIPDLKGVRDMATAAKAWAKSRGLGIEAENDASEYILRAERGIGQELSRMAEAGERRPQHPGLQPGMANSYDPESALAIPDTTLASIGISKTDSSRWQHVARLTEDEFERLLREARASSERIAKINFYRAPSKRTDDKPETRSDLGFATLRAGAYHLLGWRVNKDGVGEATKNGLLTLPEDELRELARLIKVLVEAYQEAKASRG